MPDKLFKITLRCAGTSARVAELALLHGKVITPIFLPVGTQATVRAWTPGDLEDIGIKMLLCNAYHLYLRPGIDVISEGRRAAQLHGLGRNLF